MLHEALLEEFKMIAGYYILSFNYSVSPVLEI